MEIINQIKFPEYTGIKCNMMPFIQGESSSLPEEYKSYSKIIDDNFLEKGEIGFLTIDETFVKAGKSQRGYNSKGIHRNVHIEVGHEGLICSWGKSPQWGKGDSLHWSQPRWGAHWGNSARTTLEHNTKVLISNSISDTCRVWKEKEFRSTPDGDLSEYIEDYPEETGLLLKSGELAKISIFSPHECIPQKKDEFRQFFRIVGKGVKGREEYFTQNPLVNY